MYSEGVVPCWACVEMLVLFMVQNLDKCHIMIIEWLYFKALRDEEENRMIQIIGQHEKDLY